MTLDALYASAPLLDAEEEQQDSQSPDNEEILESAGVMTMAPESFDAAVLELLVHP